MGGCFGFCHQRKEYRRGCFCQGRKEYKGRGGAVFAMKGKNKGGGLKIFWFGSKVSMRTNSDSLLVKLGEGG